VAGAHFAELESLAPLLLGIVSFSLAASFGYILNDLSDIEIDKLHIKKKYRPIASGAVSKSTAYIIAGIILAFVFFSLAALKRYTEVRHLASTSAAKLSVGGRGYSTRDGGLLQVLGVISGMGAVATLIGYSLSQEVSSNYVNPLLLLFVPIILATWLNRAWVKAQVGEMHSDPIVYAIKDKSSYLALLATLSVMAAARFL